jgi:membrane protein DedA with SNARE-associated domain
VEDLYNGWLRVDILSILHDHIAFFPALAFAALLLAGLNVPISEDLVIIAGAMLSREAPDRLAANVAGLYAGVLLSDILSYWLGRGVRQGVKMAQRIEKAIPVAALDKMHRLIDRFGILTFIVCRFIPFGVRNTLFISSGLFGLSFKKFLLFDIIASVISVSTLFSLVYRYGDIIEKPFRAVGGWLFAGILAAALAGALLLLRRYVWKRKE